MIELTFLADCVFAGNAIHFTPEHNTRNADADATRYIADVEFAILLRAIFNGRHTQDDDLHTHATLHAIVFDFVIYFDSSGSGVDASFVFLFFFSSFRS